MQIQTIDLNNTAAATNLVESLHSTGFAIIDNVEFDFNIINEFYKEWAHFFQNPNEDYLYDEQSGSGWVTKDRSETAKGYKVQDIKEFYHYYLHGQCPDHLLEITKTTFFQSFYLASKLLDWIQLATPKTISNSFSMPLSNMICRKNTLLRIIHYPPVGEYFIEGGIRAAPHEDINLITILPAGTADGLEVMLDNGEWFPVRLNSNQCVVNIGDMLQECSSGYFRSTKHRVVNPDQKDVPRYSMPLFLHAKDDVILSERYNAKEYLMERLKEIGLVKA